jgi:hypothetical protein
MSEHNLTKYFLGWLIRALSSPLKTLGKAVTVEGQFQGGKA